MAKPDGTYGFCHKRGALSVQFHHLIGIAERFAKLSYVDGVGIAV